MASAYNADLQQAARFQLDYILEWEAQNPEQDVLPPIIHDLMSVRPHLELVAAGGTAFNEAAVNARVNKDFFAAEYDLEELRATSSLVTTPTRQVYTPLTVAAGTTGNNQHTQAITSLTDFLRRLSRRWPVGGPRRGCLGAPFDYLHYCHYCVFFRLCR
jgi:hypothetical protein